VFAINWTGEAARATTELHLTTGLSTAGLAPVSPDSDGYLVVPARSGVLFSGDDAPG
jgi:hypothetical protein